MIESGELGELPAEVHKAILEIAMSANEMTKLIDDLAEVGRLKEPDRVLRRERYPVTQLIKDAVDVARAEALAKKIAIIERIDPSRSTIQVDIGRMKIAVQNLLSNAVRYSPPESSVEVRVEPEHGALTIAWRIKGTGFQARRFRAFSTSITAAPARKFKIRRGQASGCTSSSRSPSYTAAARRSTARLVRAPPSDCF